MAGVLLLAVGTTAVASQAVAQPAVVEQSPAVGEDVALSGQATASSTYPATSSASFAAANVNDGDPATRWGTEYTRTTAPIITHDPSADWVQIALPVPTVVDHVVLVWESAYGAQFELQGSVDGTSWTTLRAVTDGTGGTETFAVDSASAWSFVRMQGVKPATKYGYSIYTFAIWNGPEPTPPSTGGIVPEPVDQVTTVGEPFRLVPGSAIVVDDEALTRTATLLAQRLRVATGYDVPVRTSADAAPNDIQLALGDLETGAATTFAKDEAYRLTADENGASIVGQTGAAVFDGVQTLLQLFPRFIYATTVHTTDWKIDPVTVIDYPRFAVRGLAIDPARNFLSVASVKTIIDEMAIVKSNRLHIHLTDDQGWRIQIPSWPNLTEHGGTGSIAGGISGFYTQADFRDIVAYAADRNIEVVPEIDMPGHMTAAVSSYPELSCDGAQIPMLTTGATGTVSVCASNETTYSFIDDVITAVAEVSPSPYIHIGGDEVSGMTSSQYSTFMQRVQSIARAHGKTIIGWTPAPSSGIDSSAVYQYWADRQNITTSAWFANDRPVILSPTFYAYLDYGFTTGEDVGWKYTNHDTTQSYSFDPSNVVDETTGKNLNTAFGLSEGQTQGVEAAIWGERMLRGLPDVEYSIWPRLASLMEKAWSTPAHSSDVADFLTRAGQLGSGLQLAGVNIWADPKVPWAAEIAGLPQAATVGTAYSGALAQMSSLRTSLESLSVTVDWGDGETGVGSLSGTEASKGTVATPFTVSGAHTYASAGTYTAVVTVTSGSSAGVSTSVTITVGQTSPSGPDLPGDPGTPGAPVKPAASALALSLGKTKVPAGSKQKVTVRLTAAGRAASGTVVIVDNGKKVAVVAVPASGKVLAALPAVISTGSHRLVATYAGSAAVAAARSAVASYTVSKAKGRVKIKAKSSVKKGKRLTVKIAVKASKGLTRSGRAKIRLGAGRWKTVKVSAAGTVTVKLRATKRGRQKVSVKYLGSKNVSARTSSKVVRVR